MKPPTTHRNIHEYHSFSTNAIRPYYDMMPHWIREQVDLTHQRYQIFKKIYYENERNDIDKNRNRQSLEEWSSDSKKLIRRIYYDLKTSVDRNILCCYFEKKTPSTIKKERDRLAVINRLLEVSYHVDRNEIEIYMEKLRNIRRRGSEILNARSDHKLARKNSSQKLIKAKKHWLSQYTKMKLAIKAYFYETEVDYHDLFLDFSKKKGSDELESLQQEFEKLEERIEHEHILSSGELEIAPPPSQFMDEENIL